MTSVDFFGQFATRKLLSAYGSMSMASVMHFTKVIIPNSQIDISYSMHQYRPYVCKITILSSYDSAHRFIIECFNRIYKTSWLESSRPIQDMMGALLSRSNKWRKEVWGEASRKSTIWCGTTMVYPNHCIGMCIIGATWEVHDASQLKEFASPMSLALLGIALALWPCLASCFWFGCPLVWMNSFTWVTYISFHFSYGALIYIH